MKFEIFRRLKRTPLRLPVWEYRWRLKGRNGKIVAQSEGYTQKRNARGTIDALRRAGLRARVVDVTGERKHG